MTAERQNRGSRDKLETQQRHNRNRIETGQKQKNDIIENSNDEIETELRQHKQNRNTIET